MQPMFQYRAYAEHNSDLAERYGAEDEPSLRDHFERYGRHEMRGLAIGDYMRLEGVILSDQGHLYMAGWADRRILSQLSFAVEVGYLRYEIGVPDMRWFHRADVAAVTGDSTLPAGFLCLTKLEGFVPHARLRVFVNGKPMYEEGVARLVSPDLFLTRALGACAVLSDQPAGMTLEHAQALQPVFSELWAEVRGAMRFVETLSRRSGAEIRQSVIITIWRKADMLLVQLAMLARALQETGTEVIVIGNELQEADRLMAELTAFCQIHPIDLSVWLCSGNSGFSAANNFGATKARGEVLVFMNPDIFPPEAEGDATARAFFTRDPGEALHGALLYYGDGLLMHSGMYTTADVIFDARAGVRHEILRVEHFGKGLSHHIEDPDLGEVTAAIAGREVLASAALWKIRRSLFEEIGGLPEDYIVAYYEDADFCLQLLRAGRRIEIDTSARWLHLEGVGKPRPPAMRCFMWLNRALYTRRFLGDPRVADAGTDLTQL